MMCSFFASIISLLKPVVNLYWKSNCTAVHMFQRICWYYHFLKWTIAKIVGKKKSIFIFTKKKRNL